MTKSNHLSDLWQHTIAKILKHNLKYEWGFMLKQWIKLNKLENFISILNYTIDNFTPSGNLYYINENGEILHQTPLKELFNLRWFMQHLIHQSEDENENFLSQENWMKQTNWKFIKYVIHHKHSMTPEQLKEKPFKPIIKIDHGQSDTEEVESTKEEKSNSLHLFIIFYFSLKKQNKNKSLLSSFLLNIFFSSLRLDIQSLNIFFSEKRLDI